MKTVEDIQYEIAERYSIMTENNATPQEILKEIQTERRRHINALKNQGLSLGQAAAKVIDTERLVAKEISGFTIK